MEPIKEWDRVTISGHAVNIKQGVAVYSMKDREGRAWKVYVDGVNETMSINERFLKKVEDGTEPNILKQAMEEFEPDWVKMDRGDINRQAHDMWLRLHK